MNQELAGIILAVAALGAIGSAFMGLVTMYRRDAKKIHEKYKNKKVVLPPAQEAPLPQVDATPKPQNPLVVFAWCVGIYWVVFAGIIHWLSGDTEVADSTMMAPIILPFAWLWGILSSERFWYGAGIVFAIWFVEQQVIKPIHDKLDRILERLR